MGSRTQTRRFSTAVAATGLTVGAGVGLVGAPAHAQEPRSEEPSTAALCAAHYQVPGVSAAAHLLRDLRKAARPGEAPVALHGLRCGRVAGAAVPRSHPGTGEKTGAHSPHTSTSDRTAGAPAYDHDSEESTGDQSTSGVETHNGYADHEGHHYGYRHHGYGHHGYGHHGYGHHGYGHHGTGTATTGGTTMAGATGKVTTTEPRATR